MGAPLDRRRGAGRRRSDTRDTRALRGLLHDLGHEMTTLSYLVEAVRGDVSLPHDSGSRLELLALEMSRLLDLIAHGLGSVDEAADREPIHLREMMTQLARLASLAHGADVALLPGPDAAPEMNAILLWRVLSNVIDNAARAAGPGGQVKLTIRQDGRTVIEVADNGPGFGAGPPGTASLGLDIVTSLLEASGGSLEVTSAAGVGATVRVLLPGQVPVPSGARQYQDW
jgi:signal transduction histidine kinase